MVQIGESCQKRISRKDGGRLILSMSISNNDSSKRVNLLVKIKMGKGIVIDWQTRRFFGSVGMSP
jgi:hypothetical protein